MWHRSQYSVSLILLPLSLFFLSFFLSSLKHMEYKNGYSADHLVIKRFWEVFLELSTEAKKKFLGAVNCVFCLNSTCTSIHPYCVLIIHYGIFRVFNFFFYSTFVPCSLLCTCTSVVVVVVFYLQCSTQGVTGFQLPGSKA